MARVSLEQLRANRPQVDRDKLDATTEADIRRHAIEDGQDPDAELSGYKLVPAPAEIRKKLGATQAGFAEVLGVPLATYRNWEQGRKVPDPAARSLLTIFDREPEAAVRALSGGKLLAKAVKRSRRRGYGSVSLADSSSLSAEVVIRTQGGLIKHRTKTGKPGIGVPRLSDKGTPKPAKV